MVRAGTTVEQMVRAIADMIVTGAMVPGERLDEGSLATRFEVSRTPVREALRELGAMGLVSREPNRSATVTNVAETHLHAMFEAMAELEGICAKLAASRMTDTERQALADGHEASIQLVQSGRREDYAAYNTEFHNSLYRGTHNDHLVDLALQTRARLAPFRRAQFRLPGRLTDSHQEHDRIVAAILKADPDAAAEAARAHVAIVETASVVFAAPAARA